MLIVPPDHEGSAERQEAERPQERHQVGRIGPDLRPVRHAPTLLCGVQGEQAALVGGLKLVKRADLGGSPEKRKVAADHQAVAYVTMNREADIAEHQNDDDQLKGAEHQPVCTV